MSEKSETCWFFNKVATVAFIAGVLGLALAAGAGVWGETIAVKLGLSVAAVCTVVFPASIFLALVSKETTDKTEETKANTDT